MRGSVAVGVSSLVFACLHFRQVEEPVPVEQTAVKMAILTVASVLSIVVAVYLLRMRGATWADLGVVPRKLLTDVKLGLLAFLAVTPPLLLLFAFCKSVFPTNVTPDPVPLFFLAVALGVLCYRTRRIAPAIVLHAAFNGVGVLSGLLNAPK
jgi:membrane protease YdiL (CAAX protease family)